MLKIDRGAGCLCHSYIPLVILGAWLLKAEANVMTNTFWVWLSEQGQAISIALLAFLFGGALLLGFL
jgi:hypothetical protein